MLSLSENTRARMQRLTLELRCDNSWARMMRAFDVLRDVVEEKYRPDQPRAPKGTPEGGQWIVDASSARQRRLRGVRVLLAWLLMGFRRHGIHQSITRGVSPGAIRDAINNPLKIGPGSSPNSWRYYGNDAVVGLNPFGQVITVWPQ